MSKSRIYQRPDREHLYLAVYDPLTGIEHRESAHTSDPAIAGLRLAQLEGQLATGQYLPPGERRAAAAKDAASLHSAVAEYIAEKVANGATQSHVQTSAYLLFNFLEFFEGCSPVPPHLVSADLPKCRLRLARLRSTPENEVDDLLASRSSDRPLRLMSPALIEAFKQYRLATKGADITSVNGGLKVLRTFSRWLVDKDFLAKNPARGVRDVFDSDPPTARSLTLSEAKALSEACRGELKDWFLLVALHGLRKSEAGTLRACDIHLDEGFIHICHHRGEDGRLIWSPKYRRERKVPIVARARPFMRRLAERDPRTDGTIFGLRDRRKAFSSALCRAGIEGHVRIHDLRHTTYTHVKIGALENMDREIALADIRCIFGHADGSMDRIYDHRSVDRLRKLAELSALPGVLLGKTEEVDGTD